MRRIHQVLSSVAACLSPCLDVPRLRLAMLSYGLPVERQKRGGIERAAHTLADGLARRGHDVVVFSHDPKPDGAAYDVRELPWKSFVNTWVGRRLTMGYLGNVLAMVPDYREFDAVIAHGDSLLLPLTGKPVLRVMHGSALGEARSATSIGRCVLQLGVYAQELLTALCQRGVVAVSENTRRDNPFVAQRHPARRGRQLLHAVAGGRRAPSRRCCSSARSTAASAGGSCSTVREDDPCRASRRHADDSSAATGPAHAGRDATSPASPTRSWPISTGARGSTPRPARTRASACRTSKRWRAARRSSHSENPGSLEVLGDGACGLLPADEEFAAERVAALLGDEARRAELLDDRGLRARRCTLARRMLDSYEKVLFDLTGVLCQVHGFRSSALTYDDSPTPISSRRRLTMRVAAGPRLFIAMQLLWGARAVPARRAGVRVYGPRASVPRRAGGARLLLPPRDRRAAARQHEVAGRVLLLLVLNLLHATTHLMAGLAQVVFQVGIAAPVFWMARAVRSEAQLDALVWVVFVVSALGVGARHSAGLLPRTFSAARVQRAGALAESRHRFSSLTYIGADGREIIRPPGLSDMPGGAAVAGMMTMILGPVAGACSRDQTLARPRRRASRRRRSA